MCAHVCLHAMRVSLCAGGWNQPKRCTRVKRLIGAIAKRAHTVPTATLGRGCSTTPVQPHRRPRATTVPAAVRRLAAAVRVAQAPREPRPRARRAGHVPRGSEGHAHPQGPSGRAAAAEGNTLLVFVCGVHTIGDTMLWLPRVGPPAALADGDAIPCRGRLPCCGGYRARMPVSGSRRAPRVVRQLLCVSRHPLCHT